MSVEGNLEYYRIQKGIPGKGKVAEILKAIGLYEKRKAPARKLSFGMKQRLGLGIALMGEPELLLLDEPINGLDPSGIMEIREMLWRLSREKNIAVILSSHILTELEQLADKYCFLNKGKVLQQISAEDLKDECSSYIEIQVSDPRLFAVRMEKRYPEQKYQVLPDRRIRILGEEIEPERFSSLAAENGIQVSSLAVKSITLEEYYMDLKRGGGRS